MCDLDIEYKDFESIIKKGGYNGFGKGTNIKPGQEDTSKECNGKTVNEIAIEVIQGKWGAGQERINKLTAAWCDYDTIQSEVNRILGN